MKLLSVIIPIYNSEKYLSKCLESVLSSTYNNLEIICVNDGSTDKSSEILELYKNRDKRIIVINKKNEGAQEARKLAYNICKGDYITNIDSDDFIENDTFQKSIEALEEVNVDVSIYDSYYYFRDKLIKINKLKNSSIVSGKDSFIYSLKWEISGLGIFKRNILLKSIEIPFLYNGDEVITRNIFLNSKNIVLSEGKYFYRQNNESLTKNKNFNKRRFETVLSNLYIEKLIKENNLVGKEIDDFKIRNIKDFIRQIKKVLKNKEKLENKDVINIKNIVKKRIQRLDINLLNTYYLNKLEIIKLIKMRIRLKIYVKKIEKL